MWQSYLFNKYTLVYVGLNIYIATADISPALPRCHTSCRLTSDSRLACVPVTKLFVPDSTRKLFQVWGGHTSYRAVFWIIKSFWTILKIWFQLCQHFRHSRYAYFSLQLLRHELNFVCLWVHKYMLFYYISSDTGWRKAYDNYLGKNDCLIDLGSVYQ